MALNARIKSRASEAVRPFTAADIIDADDWLMEQPWPEILMSATRSAAPPSAPLPSSKLSSATTMST